MNQRVLRALGACLAPAVGLMTGCAVGTGGDVSTDTEMAEITGGTAKIGLGDETKLDAPSKVVDIPTFFIDKYEVTNAQYRACVKNGKCSEPALGGFGQIPDYFTNPKYDEMPVAFVTYYQAGAYCKAQGKRLPLELEWEKAARGTDGRLYPWGDSAPTCDRAQYGECNETREQGAGPMPVGSLTGGVSPYDVYDMSGNVAEWVADWYDPDIYASFEEGQLPVRAEAGRLKSIRGGSWWCEEDRLLAGRREAMAPTYRAGNIGFRCAK